MSAVAFLIVTYPVRDVSFPASLAGQQNGRLDPSVLSTTPGAAGGPSVVLTKPASRAWRALCAAAKGAGHTLKASSTVDTYRPYAVQRSIFLDRYRTTYKPNTDVKWWEGRRWYRWYGATAAAPGTSNHGWGLAVDTGEERDGDSGTESMDSTTVSWLVAHELAFGWSHEIQSEPWHIRYFAGDAIPAAVLAYERSTAPTPSSPPDLSPPLEDHMLYRTPSGSVCFLTNGKLLLVVDKLDGVSQAETAQLLHIQASLPVEARTPVPCDSVFWARLTSAFPVVRG